MPRRNRLYVISQNNTTQTVSNQNTFETFPYPSQSYVTVRKDEKIDISINQTRFTYDGDNPTWFLVMSQVNIIRTAGSDHTVPIIIDFQWFKNGSAYGAVRSVTLLDSQIISGFGYMALSKDDYVEPMIRNTTSNEQIIIKSADFLFSEDNGY